MSEKLFLRASMLAAACLWASPSISQGFSLPDGPGKETVSAICGSCHDISRLGAGYTPEGWNTVVTMMVNFGAPIPRNQIATIKDYLTKSFPERPRPAAAIIPGPVEATIKEWPVLTPGSRPHDPWVTQDGAIWYSGQLSNKLGRLDPKTGEVKEFQLAAQTGPHGITADKEGNIWYAGNFQGLIGKYDPKTGKVTEYPLPDPAARDPHTLVFDQSGILWFTVQQANMIGRLDPATGDIKLLTSPTAKSRPYGIQINSKGVPFYVDFGAAKISSIDPKTFQIREYPLPDATARPRRLAIDDHDIIYYADFSRGFLGRLDPQTGQVTEWQSPSGPKSEPYGIVFTKGAIWYSESFAKPTTIVRFDPKTEKFQSWAIPGPMGGDIVRNMAITPDGNPVVANSLSNEVGLVDVK
jgi:virginiamycin B lyase